MRMRRKSKTMKMTMIDPRKKYGDWSKSTSGRGWGRRRTGDSQRGIAKRALALGDGSRGRA
jgi:hypothetical protein